MLVTCVSAFVLSAAVGMGETPLMVDTFEDAAVDGFPDAPQVGTWTSGILEPFVGEGVLDGHDLRFVDPGDGQYRAAYATTPDVGLGIYRYDFEFVVLDMPSASDAFFNLVTSDIATGAFDRFVLAYDMTTGDQLIEVWVNGPFYEVGTWALGERHAVRIEFDTAASSIRYFVDDLTTPVVDRMTVGARRESASFSTITTGSANVAIDNVSFVFVPGTGAWVLPAVAGAFGLRRGRGRP